MVPVVQAEQAVPAELEVQEVLAVQAAQLVQEELVVQADPAAVVAAVVLVDIPMVREMFQTQAQLVAVVLVFLAELVAHRLELSQQTLLQELQMLAALEELFLTERRDQVVTVVI